MLGETGQAVWVTDATGADALEIGSVTGEPGIETVRLAAGQLGNVVGLTASPDGATVAAAAHDGRLLVVDVASGQVTELAASDDGVGQRAVLVAGLGLAGLGPARPAAAGPHPAGAGQPTSEVIDVTDGRFADSDPVFTSDGLYLAFISRRSFDPVYDEQTFDMSFPLGSRPYLVPLAAETPSPFGPLPGGRPLGQDPPAPDKDKDKDDDPERTEVSVDADGISGRVVGVPVVEARYSSLRAVKGGLAWLREPVAGVLGEGVASPEDDAPRPVLERFDLRKREVAELVGELDWFDVSGDGTRLVVKDHDELRILPSEHKEDHGSSESVTVDLSRARFQADPAALWQHAFAEAGRLMRRDFWNPGMSGVDWDAVLDSYRPLLDRIRGADDFTDLMWEVVAELGTSHAYIVRAGQDFRGPAPARPPSGCSARTSPATRPAAGWWTGCCRARRPTRGRARRSRRPAW